MYRTFTQDDPLPGRCDQAIQFDGMPTVFECQGRPDHRSGTGWCTPCSFEEGGRGEGFSLDWWPDEDDDEPEETG